MSPSCRPVVLSPFLLTEFLEFLLQPRTSVSTLIICSTRDEFLQDLLAACHNQPRNSPLPVELCDVSPSKHAFLTPTIYLLAMSRTVNLAFTPTLNHLRAYLAAYAAPQGLGEHDITFDKPASRPPILAVINALQLHTSSGELSAQGLSRTLALALATAVRSDMRLVVGDSPTTAEFDTDDSESQSGTAPLRDQWTQQVPLLSGSIRFGGDQRVWAGRTIEARRVAGRWCQFTKLEELQNEG